MTRLKYALEENAEIAIKQYAKDYAAAILLYAKLSARRNNSDIVNSSHIDDAIALINRNRKKFWSRDLMITLGGAFFGAFIQGFVTELGNNNSLLITVYVIIGFIGLILVFWGLSQ
jgi:hypothetical protein